MEQQKIRKQIKPLPILLRELAEKIENLNNKMDEVVGKINLIETKVNPIELDPEIKDIIKEKINEQRRIITN